MPIRNDRRRRVLADDSQASDSEATGARVGTALQAASGKRYSAAADRENLPRVTDLAPVNGLSFTLAIGLALILIAALVSAHVWLPRLARLAPREVLTPLDLTAEHSLANWFASLLLLTNMQMALVVYSVRRHRVDDYHGRYRVWLAVALASLVASIDLATGVSPLVKIALAPAARWCGVAEHYGFWAVAGTIVTYLTIRLVLETSRAWPTLLSLFLAAVTLALPWTLDLEWLKLESLDQVVIFRMACRLVGCLLLVAGTTLFVRHVLLDVEGKLPQRKSRPKKLKVKKTRRVAASADGTTTSTSSKVTIDPPQKPKPYVAPRTDVDPAPRTASPLGSRVASTVNKPATSFKPQSSSNSNDEDDDDADEEDSSDMRNLSRAERKRLKREAKLARRAAA